MYSKQLSTSALSLAKQNTCCRSLSNSATLISSTPLNSLSNYLVRTRKQRLNPNSELITNFSTYTTIPQINYFYWLLSRHFVKTGNI